jgi:hypothetical protein
VVTAALHGGRAKGSSGGGCPFRGGRCSSYGSGGRPFHGGGRSLIHLKRIYNF